MKKLLILLFSMLITFASSSGASDEPTQYVYAIYDHNDALKYTISKGDMDSSGCFFSQMIFSKEAQNAMKNNLTIDFMNSDFTPTSIDLYKNKVYWVDLDLNTKIKNNFVKMGNSSGDQLLELIHQDDELIFRMKMSNNGSTAVCDFPFRKLELDEDGFPIKTICQFDDDDVEFRNDGLIYLSNSIQPFTGKNVCKFTNGQILLQGMYKAGKEDGNWISWHWNGQMEAEENLKDGEYDGKRTWWYDNGQIQFEENYKDGKKDGKQTRWYENGQIEWKLNYIDDKHDGTQYAFYEDGQIKIESNMKLHRRHGKRTEWYASGQKRSEATYKDGECISGDCD